jgi:hypothetical protein
MKRAVPIALVVLLALGAGVYLLFFRGDSSSSAEGPADRGGETAERRAGAASEPPPMSPGDLVRHDDDPEGSLLLEGQVVDGDGVGVGGATVTLTSNPPRTAETEDDGSFSFDKLIGRTYALTARAGDLAGGPVTHQLTASSDPVIIRMRTGGAVEVTVVAGASGEPIAGAAVELRAADFQSASTGADGVARFRGVASGWLVVAARAPGYGTARTALMMPSSEGASLKARLGLDAGASVSGRVIAEDGSPIAGAVVVAEPAGQVFSMIDHRRDGVTSDAAGAFRLENVSGRVRIGAHHKDFAPASSEPVQVAGDVTGVEIEMARGGLVAGRVLDASKRPVAGAQVLVQAKGSNGFGGGEGRRGGRSDESGAFEIKGLPRGELVVMAAGEEASSDIVAVDLRDRNEARGLEIVLSVTGIIAGVVVDGEGEPVPEVPVMLMPDWTTGVDGERFALRSFQTETTTGDGRFRFSGLSEGSYLLHPSRGAANPMSGTRGTRARAGDTDVRLTLLADGGVRGKVVSERGEPVDMFTVTVGWPPGHPVSDPGGAFDLSGIAPGSYDLRIRGADFAEKTVADVVVAPGETRDLGTIEVRVGRSLSGRVVGRGGAPVAGATVAVGRQLIGSGESISMSSGGNTDEMMGIRSAVTELDGRFRIRGLPERDLVAVAEHGTEGRSRPVPVPRGPAQIEREIQLIPTGAVVGVVRKGDQPAPRVQVIAAAPEDRMQMVVVQADEKGRFRIDRLAEGRYDISAVIGAGMGASGVTAPAQVTGGRETRVELVMEVGEVTMAIAVAAEPGAKVDAVQVFVFRDQVAPKNGKEVNDAFLGAQGSGAAMRFSGPGKSVEIPEQPAGPRTLCGIPITGDMSDPKFLQRLQDEAMHLEVTCLPIELAATPARQTFELVVPEMKPLPAPEQRLGRR